MEILATRMREVRKNQGFTQEAAAKALGIAWLSYQRYESNARDPRAPFIADFARYFHVSTDYLLGLTDTP